MKKTGILRSGICLAVFCMLALHCANPFAPRITIVTPDEPVIIEDAVTYSLPVEVSVPVPGCGATVYPVDTGTFQATLTKLLDDEVVSETDVTTDLGDPVLDPETGTNTWTGTVDLADFGDYELKFTIDNEMDTGANHHSFRLEQTVALLEAGYPTVTVSSLTQDPKSCLVLGAALNILLPMLQQFDFIFGPLSGSAIGTGLSVDLELPVLGTIEDILLTLDEPNNDILMDGPDDYTIDFSTLGIPLPGFDCIITAAADGAWDDTDPNDPDGFLTISISDVQDAGAEEDCILDNDTPGFVWDCLLTVGLDGNP